MTTSNEHLNNDLQLGDGGEEQPQASKGGNGMAAPPVRIFHLTGEQFRELLAAGRVTEAIPGDEVNEGSLPKTEVSPLPSNKGITRSDVVPNSAIQDDGTIIS